MPDQYIGVGKENIVGFKCESALALQVIPCLHSNSVFRGHVSAATGVDSSKLHSKPQEYNFLRCQPELASTGADLQSCEYSQDLSIGTRSRDHSNGLRVSFFNFEDVEINAGRRRSSTCSWRSCICVNQAYWRYIY